MCSLGNSKALWVIWGRYPKALRVVWGRNLLLVIGFVVVVHFLVVLFCFYASQTAYKEALKYTAISYDCLGLMVQQL